MLKRVEEDWSYFNRAVREKAEGHPRPEAPPLKLVTPHPPSALNKPAPPTPPPPVQLPSAAAMPASPFAAPKPSPALNKSAPPVPPALPPQSPPATAAAPSSPSRSHALSVGWVIDPIIKLLLGVAAIILLIALIEAGSRNANPAGPAATGTGPGVGANGAVGTEKVVTDYTTFNTAMYRSWKVVTGWKFADSHATQPDRQYCYLEVLTTGGQQIYDIEERAPVRRHDMPGALIPGLDKAGWDEAATRCVWHR